MKYTCEDTEIERIREALPRIVSPNLGCPLILSANAPQDTHAYLVLAESREEDIPEWASYGLQAEPSFPEHGGGKKFLLDMKELEELKDDALPESFTDVAETRLLISTTLRSIVFRNQARFWSFRLSPKNGVGQDNLRQVNGDPRSTLYDLVLCRGQKETHRVKHALCLRPCSPKVHFVHLTDLHVAARNDMWAKETNRILNPPLGACPLQFINFNERLRRFIQFANQKADAGELDLVLAMGDLVDFVQPGFGKPNPGENNWHLLQDILTGDQGLRVPLYTTSGNHDWRLYPYPHEFNADIFGLSKEQAKKLDYLYHDSSSVIREKIQRVHSKLIKKGSPILARSWWRSIVAFGLPKLELILERISTWFAAFEGRLLKISALVLLLGSLGHGYFSGKDLSYFGSLIFIFLLLYMTWQFLVRPWVGNLLRSKITALLGIQSTVDGLRDYFLELNPYFNYAFRLENCYYLVLDTGHDCLTAQSFWDDGGKKIKRVSVRDNIMGGSPDTMGFFPPNQYFHYSQISFLEMVLDCIRQTHNQKVDEPRKCRIFAGVHTPPANLSKSDRRRADRKAMKAQDHQILMPQRHRLLGGFDIRYGSINHYMSEFFYLCLGYKQSDLCNPSGPGIDAVFAGHAHWSIEFKLKRPHGAPSDSWKPQVYYGNFSQQLGASNNLRDRWWGPLLFQTAACGPPSHTDKYTPYCRYVTVDAQLGVSNLSQRNVRLLECPQDAR